MKPTELIRKITVAPFAFLFILGSAAHWVLLVRAYYSGSVGGWSVAMACAMLFGAAMLVYLLLAVNKEVNRLLEIQEPEREETAEEVYVKSAWDQLKYEYGQWKLRKKQKIKPQ